MLEIVPGKVSFSYQTLHCRGSFYLYYMVENSRRELPASNYSSGVHQSLHRSIIRGCHRYKTSFLIQDQVQRLWGARFITTHSLEGLNTDEMLGCKMHRKSWKCFIQILVKHEKFIHSFILSFDLFQYPKMMYVVVVFLKGKSVSTDNQQKINICN